MCVLGVSMLSLLLRFSDCIIELFRQCGISYFVRFSFYYYNVRCNSSRSNNNLNFVLFRFSFDI